MKNSNGILWFINQPYFILCPFLHVDQFLWEAVGASRSTAMFLGGLASPLGLVHLATADTSATMKGCPVAVPWPQQQEMVDLFIQAGERIKVLEKQIDSDDRKTWKKSMKKQWCGVFKGKTFFFFLMRLSWRKRTKEKNIIMSGHLIFQPIYVSHISMNNYFLMTEVILWQMCPLAALVLIKFGGELWNPRQGLFLRCLDWPSHGRIDRFCLKPNRPNQWTFILWEYPPNHLIKKHNNNII